jgi:hypothetical protein
MNFINNSTAQEVLNEYKEAAAPKHTHHEIKHLEAQVPKNKKTPNQQKKKQDLLHL